MFKPNEIYSSSAASISTKKSVASSGYSGDHEDESTHNTRSETESSKTQNKKENSVINHPKQHIREEDHFHAANVRTDIERSGKAFPSLVSRRKFNCMIDLTTVVHCLSDDYDAERSKVEKLSKGQSHPRVHNYQSESLYRELLRSCRSSHYCDFGEERGDNCFSDLTNSNNGSDNDNDNDSQKSNSSMKQRTSVSVPERLDDVILSTSSDKSIHDKNLCRTNLELRKALQKTELVTSFPSSCMTLSQAVTFSAKARLVTEAVEPFTIVYSNAAYTKYSGLESTKVSGKTLQEIISKPSKGTKKNGKRKSSLDSLGVSFSTDKMCDKKEAATDNKIISQDNDTMNVCVLPVRSVAQGDNASHFVIEFSDIVDGGLDVEVLAPRKKLKQMFAVG